MQNKKIEIYIDGSCKPTNPGPCGCGAILVIDDIRKKAYGDFLGEGTNNIAELNALHLALDIIDEEKILTDVTIKTDSQYLIGLMIKNWNPKVNQELVKNLKTRFEKYKNVSIEWVKGHSNVKFNEEADRVAKGAIDKAMAEGLL